jgi:hypothetical protein
VGYSVVNANRVRRWLRRTNIYTGPIAKLKAYGEYDSLPTVPRAGELAIAGTLQKPKWALLDCPCGNGHTILLSLQATTIPHWSLTLGKSRRPTLAPSVDRVAERRCHFWLQDGRVTWV